jgi:taurine dioxygenase
MAIEVRTLKDGLAFGARIRGVTRDVLADEAARQQIRDVFERRGLIVFEEVEPSARMHVALSEVFGPLKDHPVPSVPRVDQDAMPGVIDLMHSPGHGGVVEVGGKLLSYWLPWHFDHCYNNELNRAGVLRAIVVAPEGGLTMFADGIQLYEALSPGLRERIEGRNIIYTLDLAYSRMRFGVPRGFRDVRAAPSQAETVAHAKTMPRAVHPAVWTRASGEKVLHVSPWMSVGIEGAETPEGDELLEAVCQELAAHAEANAYAHAWNTTDMLIWDNWRVLHRVSGMDPKHTRHMQRTTIKGDYGLGYFEHGATGDAALEMTV